jgi:hypothetical protein
MIAAMIPPGPTGFAVNSSDGILRNRAGHGLGPA